jgi:hypothetical protein
LRSFRSARLIPLQNGEARLSHCSLGMIKLEQVRSEVLERFERVDRRFAANDQRLARIDQRTQELTEHIEALLEALYDGRTQTKPLQEDGTKEERTGRSQ